MLTITTSANLSLRAQTLGGTGLGLLLTSLGLIGALVSFKPSRPHGAFLRMAAGALTVITLALALVSCGGSSTNGQMNRSATSIMVTAQSGAVSHTATISVTLQ